MFTWLTKLIKTVVKFIISHTMEHVSLDSQPHSSTKAKLTFDETCPNSDEESMCISKEVGCAEIYA